jgi:hypothetical protein
MCLQSAGGKPSTRKRELLDPAWAGLRTREPELQQTRAALADPERALLVAAVEKAERLTPGDQILAGQIESLSPAELESMIQLLSARPTLLLVLRGAIDQADLDGPGKAALRQKVVEAGRAFIPRTRSGPWRPQSSRGSRFRPGGQPSKAGRECPSTS